MGHRAYPPLTPSEVQDILKARGFRKRATKGSHQQWAREASAGRKASVVTVDVAHSQYGPELMHSMVRQSGFTSKEFYGSTRHTARSASVPFLPRVV